MESKKKGDLIESFSGVRGIFGKSITPAFARDYGRAFCSFLDCPRKIVLAGDTRPSTGILEKAMIQGFRESGVREVFYLGRAPVQVCAFAVLSFGAQAGVYITASHNEPEYNGWKFFRSDGAILYPKQAEKLIKLVHSRKETQKFKSKAKIRIINKKNAALDNYSRLVFKKIGEKTAEKIKKSNFKILIDPNGGSGAEIIERIFKKIGVKSRIINKKQGVFKRLIEPNSASLAGLTELINKGNFDFGAGFDCDADRVEMVVPAKSDFAKKIGPVVSGNYVLGLCLESVLGAARGKIAPINDCTSFLVRDIIKRVDGKIREVEVGETNIVRAMEKHKSLIGGEGSNGGVVIPPIKCRDGIMTLVLILKMLVREKKSLVEILGKYPDYFSQRAKFRVAPKESLKLKKGIEAICRKKGLKIQKTGGQTGGLKILFSKNSFLWFRQSKTEPGIFRAISDAPSKKEAEGILSIGFEMIKKLKKRKYGNI